MIKDQFLNAMLLHWQENPPSAGAKAFFQGPGMVQHRGRLPCRGLSISKLFICPHLLLKLQPVRERVHIGLARMGCLRFWIE